MTRIALEAARKSVEIETKGMAQLRAALDGELGGALERSIDLIREARGRVVVSGMGKSGHVGRKVAATLASTGTPAFFLHAAEASHGDLGMVTQDDVLLAFSWSGETAELADLIDYSKRFAVPLIAMTSRRDSALGRAADILLLLPQIEEACPNGLGADHLHHAATRARRRAGGGADRGPRLYRARFRVFHPGGKLGARLHKVDDLMHAGDDMPLLAENAGMAEVILAMSGKRLGCVGLVDDGGALTGIITDGDLRRQWGPDMQNRRPVEIMTRGPLTARAGSLASAALEVMNRRKITALFIVDAGKPVGVVHIHDLLRAGVA